MTLRCLIADDEPLAHQVLINYMTRLKSLQLVAQCYTAFEVIDALNEQPVDLIFLDIQMPELTGLDMLKTLTDPPRVILTTAYSDFTLDAFEIGVTDYLLKPIRFERFLKAVNRVLTPLKSTSQEEPSPTPILAPTAQPEPKFLTLKDKGILHKIWHDDILYMQAYGNFTKLITANRTFVSSNSMKTLATLFDEAAFVRVHKSYIVNRAKIDRIAGKHLLIGDIEIPIGETYKQVIKTDW
jgi:DNA-binding LytR/AlgR family response regulator